MKKISLLLALLLVLSVTACSKSDDTGTSPSETAVSETPSEQTSQSVGEEDGQESGEQLDDATILVFIAASLDNAFQDIIALYNESQPNVTVTTNADSSGNLLTHIQEGFECDIFFSAGASQINTAESDGLAIEGTRVDLLQNEVVVITPKGSDTAVTGIANLGDAKSIAMADGSVPVGQYTRKALQALGVLDSSLEVKDISTSDVSSALGGVEINECSNVSKVAEAVKEGSNEVGTVYYSDAYSVKDDVDIIEHVSTDLTGDIIYPMVRINNAEATDAQTAAADDFYAFLQTPEVMEIFEEYMFVSNLG